MISYKKHSIVYLLLFVMMLVQFASCSPQNSEASLSGISINCIAELIQFTELNICAI